MSIIYNGLYYIMYGFLGLITINILLSWFPGVYKFSIFRFLRKTTDTYMQPFHGILVLGMLDFTPIIGVVLFEGIIQAYIFLVNSAWALPN